MADPPDLRWSRIGLVHGTDGVLHPHDFENGADQVVIQPIRPDGQPGPDYAALEALAPRA